MPPRKPHEASNEVVLIIIVLIVALGALAGLGAVLLGRQATPAVTPPSVLGVALARSADGTNWTLTFTSVPTGLTTSIARLTILGTGGAIALAATTFSALSYSIDRVAYIQVLADASVQVGDRLLISTTTYPAGDEYQISNGTNILAAGTLIT